MKWENLILFLAICKVDCNPREAHLKTNRSEDGKNVNKESLYYSYGSELDVTEETVGAEEMYFTDRYYYDETETEAKIEITTTQKIQNVYEDYIDVYSKEELRKLTNFSSVNGYEARWKGNIVANFTPKTLIDSEDGKLQSDANVKGVVGNVTGVNEGEFDKYPEGRRAGDLRADSNDYDPRLIRLPTGDTGRGDWMGMEPAAHLPPRRHVRPGYSRLKVTDDALQTALDAFAILVWGNRVDCLKMPASYVLRSARTIAMMDLSRDKLEAMWTVVKAGKHPSKVSFRTLARFRPLFRYIPTKDLIMLNQEDSKVLSFIGTHPDLTRQQAGVVAMMFIKREPDWQRAEIINSMNGLICGLPGQLIRTIHPSVFLQLHHHIFYHINACEKLQRAILLNIMLQTEVLGGPSSWKAMDVSRLGFLLTELPGPQLKAISPEAMVGLSIKVIHKMPSVSFMFLTDAQLRNIPYRSKLVISQRLHEAHLCQAWRAGSAVTARLTTALASIALTVALTLLRPNCYLN